MGTVTKLARPILKQNHPILRAMQKARGFEDLNVSKVNWDLLERDLRHDVGVCNIVKMISDSRKLNGNKKRIRDFRYHIKKAKELYLADLKHDRLIAQSYPWGEHPSRKGCRVPPPDLLGLLSNFECGAEDALKHLRTIEGLQKINDQSLVEIGGQPLLYADIYRMTQTFKRHFKIEAKPSYSRRATVKEDGPFLRMAQFALREYGGMRYKLSSITTELEKIRAKAKKKQRPFQRRAKVSA